MGGVVGLGNCSIYIGLLLLTMIPNTDQARGEGATGDMLNRVTPPVSPVFDHLGRHRRSKIANLGLL